jgi:hypothetical protein
VPAGLGDRGYRRAQGQGRPVDVGQHHLAPVLGRVAQKAPRPTEAGVGEGDVDPSEGRERLGHHALLVLPKRDVAAHRESALGAAQLIREHTQPLLAAGGQHQAPSVRPGAARGGRSDPG